MSSISTVGVIGSGQMGSGIAQVAAQAGFDVVLRSRSLATAESTVGLIGKSLAKQVEKGRIEKGDADAIIGRITAVEDLHALDNCDLIIESVVEDLATKKALFTELDGIAKPDAILATNTSTLSVTELAVATKRPQAVVGVHFFNPAPVMSLVEIVTSITTDDDTLEAATRFAENCGKNPVVVKDRAGFIVNALLFPYLNSAVKLFEAGLATRDDIDAAMKGGCGFPMGPFALLDLVGLDTSVAILEALYAEYGDPSMRPHPQLKRMVAAGHLGRKSGRGFYDY